MTKNTNLILVAVMIINQDYLSYLFRSMSDENKIIVSKTHHVQYW